MGEYYKAHVLADAGLPVDLPVKASSTPGRQFLLYAYRSDSKLADVCLKLETGQAAELSPEEIVAAQAALDDATLAAALGSSPRQPRTRSARPSTSCSTTAWSRPATRVASADGTPSSTRAGASP